MTGGTEGLVLNATGTGTFGDGALDDNVGGVNPGVAGSGALSSLTTDLAPAAVSGNTQINSAVVNTTGDQTYNDAVNVGTSGTGNNVTTLNGNDISFNSTVDGDGVTASIEDLTVNSSTVGADIGVTSFGDGVGDDNVGGVTPIGNLITNVDGDTDINSTSITTSADQTYHDRVVIDSNDTGGALTTLNGVNITYNSTVDADTAGTESLTVNGSGITTFGDGAGNDNVGGGNANGTDFAGTGALANLTTDNSAATTDRTIINATFVSTTADQTYNDAVIISDNDTGGALTTLNGVNITFNETVDADTAGTESLTVNGSGITTFGDGTNDDIVGGGIAADAGSGALVNIITDQAGGVGERTVINAAVVTTTMDQTYNDDVIVGTSGTGIALTTLNGVDITFNNEVDAATAGTEGLTVNSSGVTTFGDATGDDNVGGGNAAVAGSGALSTLTTDDNAAPADYTLINSAVVTTTVSMTINDPLFLGTSGGGVGGTSDTVTTVNGVAVTFNNTVDALAADVQALVVNATGVTTFGDGVGNDNVGAGDSSGIAAAVAGSGALANLTTDLLTVAPANGPGSTVINATSVTTSTTVPGQGDQLFNDAVVLGSNDTGGATTTLNGNDITFTSTLDATTAGVQNLVANTSSFLGPDGMADFAGADGIAGTADDIGVGPDGQANTADDTAPDDVDQGVTTFGRAGVDGTDDNVGGITPLGTITTNADGMTVFNAASVTTTGDQDYNDNVAIAVSGTGNVTTTMTAIGTGAANITVGTTMANTMIGSPMVAPGTGDVPLNRYIGNADANVIITSAISGIYSVNGRSGETWQAANSANTELRMFQSQPLAPAVFVFSAPPAQYRVSQFLLDVGGLFVQDLWNLIPTPTFDSLWVELDYTAVNAAQRQGLQPGDIVLSSQDLFDREEDDEDEEQ